MPSFRNRNFRVHATKMPKDGPISADTPQITVVIAVYNDWAPLEDCLQSLASQVGAPTFEVVIVDDGSLETADDRLAEWKRHLSLTIVRQPHAGIATARNLGIRQSRGRTLLFTDADCRLETNCLAALQVALNDFPQHHCFQLHLVGDGSDVVGRAERLRLITLQDRVLQPDGRIRYLNTSGFAIRRPRVEKEARLFVPGLHRGEDTLLLASLIQADELPQFVPTAMVKHEVTLSLMECLPKDLRAAWREGLAYEMIESMGIRIRMTQKDRFHMLRSTWAIAADPSIGRSAWFVLVFRQSIQRIVTVFYRWLHPRAGKHGAQRAF